MCINWKCLKYFKRKNNRRPKIEIKTHQRKYIIDSNPESAGIDVIDNETSDENRQDLPVKRSNSKGTQMPEKTSDIKSLKSESGRKILTKNKHKRIELVGNHLKDEVNKDINEFERSDESIAKNGNKEISESENPKFLLNTMNEKKNFNKTEEKLVNKSFTGSHLSLNSIPETNEILNTNQKVVQNEEKIENCGHKYLSKSNIKNKESVSVKPEEDLKHSFIGRDDQTIEKREEISCKPNNKSIDLDSGLVNVKSIDIKSAKCVICWHLVLRTINLTVCSHIFCSNCLQEWLKYSQYCPVCRKFISSFAKDIRIGFNHRICVRSQKDYTVTKVYKNEDNFIDSMSAAYLFEAFWLNHKYSKYNESCIESICANISYFESIFSLSSDVQIRCKSQYILNEENNKLFELRQKQNVLQQRFKEICDETLPQMLEFWKNVVVLRERISLTHE